MPELSVAFCTRARELPLRDAVRAVVDDLGMSGINAEILVIDDGELGLEAVLVLERMAAARGIAFAYARKGEAASGLYASRRLAACKASGDVLLFLDDDAEVGPGFCKGVMAWLRDRSDVVGVGGVDELGLPLGLPPFGMAYARLFLLSGPGPGKLSRSGLNHGQASWRLQSGAFPSDYLHGCNMAFRRASLASLPDHGWLVGHSPCEDLVLSRVAAACGFLVVDPSLRVRHLCVPGGRGDRRQRMRARIRSHWHFARAYVPASPVLLAWSALGLMIKDAARSPSPAGVADVLAAYCGALSDVCRGTPR